MRPTAGYHGWYLSAMDLASIYGSLNKNDGKIISADGLTYLRSLNPINVMGIEGYAHNGGDVSWNNTVISTEVCLIGKDHGMVGVLEMNSEISIGPHAQGNWQWCKNCQELTFAGSASKGDCPAKKGTVHDHTGSLSFYLPHQTSFPSGSQDNWRWCKNCQALCFAGNKSMGKCPFGGDHSHGSGNYAVEFHVIGQPVLPEHQANWRWCNKCQVLCFDNGKGVCAADGLYHDHTGSGEYQIAFVVGADTVLINAFAQATKKTA